MEGGSIDRRGSFVLSGPSFISYRAIPSDWLAALPHAVECEVRHIAADNCVEVLTG